MIKKKDLLILLDNINDDAEVVFNHGKTVFDNLGGSFFDKETGNIIINLREFKKNRVGMQPERRNGLYGNDS